MSPMAAIEQVLADAREEAAVLRKNGHRDQADSIERLCEAVAESAHEYLTWLTEEEAVLRSSRSVTWLRSRFEEWASGGHAKIDGRRRLYRMVVVPRRARTEDAFRRGAERGRAA